MAEIKHFAILIAGIRTHPREKFCLGKYLNKLLGMESETLRAETGTTKEVANGMLKKMRKIFFLPLGELGREASIALLLESKAPPNLLLENHNVIMLMNYVGWKLGWSHRQGARLGRLSRMG